PERRVLLDRPHERVGVAHLEIELVGPRHGARLRYAPYFCKRPALASINGMRSLVGRTPRPPCRHRRSPKLSTSSRPQRPLHSNAGTGCQEWAAICVGVEWPPDTTIPSGPSARSSGTTASSCSIAAILRGRSPSSPAE